MRNLLGTQIFLNIFSILSIEHLPREVTVNIQCQQNGQTSIFSGQNSPENVSGPSNQKWLQDLLS